MRKKHLTLIPGDGNSPLDRDRPDEETFTLEAQRIVWSSDAAWGIEDPSGDIETRGKYAGQPKRIFLPRSQVRLLTHSDGSNLHDIEMPLWMAKEKGLV